MGQGLEILAVSVAVQGAEETEPNSSASELNKALKKNHASDEAQGDKPQLAPNAKDSRFCSVKYNRQNHIILRL